MTGLLTRAQAGLGLHLEEGPPYRVQCAMCGTFFTAARRHAVTCSAACRMRMSRIVEKCNATLPEGPFEIGYADPNWKFWTWSDKGLGRSPDRHYKTLDWRVIARLPIGKVFAENSVMLMWAYPSLQRTAYAVLEAWGFPDVQEAPAFNWGKMTLDGTRPVMTTGHLTRMGSEVCLFARRGKGLPRLDRGVRQFQPLPRSTIHSEKPHEFRSDIVRLFGDRPRIELFTRHEAPGWVGWGDEAGKLGEVA